MEGRIIPGIREHEGPFGEATGHYFEEESPVIEIHTVTHRRDFILPVIQVWGSEVDVLIALGGSAENIRLLKEMAPTIQDINFVPGTCSILNMDPRIKQITVVDDDVNIYDLREVQWALATRFQADRDVLILTGLQGYSIDPSVRDGMTAKLGFDATKKGEDSNVFEKINVPPGSMVRAREALGLG